MEDIDLSKFPKYEEVVKSVANLDKTNWPKIENFQNPTDFLKKVQDIFYNEFKIIPNVVRLHKPSSFSLKIFRARDLKSIKNIDLFAEHSYPPANVTNFNRCNFPGNPVFYCSNNPFTALLEVIRNYSYKGKKFCISKWGLINTDEEFVFQTFLQSNLHEHNQFNLIKEIEINQIDKPFGGKLDDDRKEGLIEYLKFIHSAFINDESYALSSCIAHRTLNANHNLATDILMYPSVQSQFKGVNMAIRPNFVDNMMKVERFYIIEVINYDVGKGKFKVKFSKYGVVNKNVIFWKKFDPDNDAVCKNFFSNDFKSYISDDISWQLTENNKNE